jgi:tetratricopeptide (TPR) repeat protein
VLLVLSLVLFFISARLLGANSSYNEAIAKTKTSNNYNEIVAPLDQAIQEHPNHPDYILTGGLSKINLLLQVYNQTKDEKFFTEAQTLLTSLQHSEPHNRLVAYQQLNFLQSKGTLPEALDWVNTQLPNYPWYIDMYESKIALSVELGNEARSQKNYQSTDTYWNQALETYNTVLQKIESLKNLPKGQEQGRAFDVTPKIAVNIGEIYFMRGDYAKAAPLLKSHLTDNLDDQLNKVIVRWYLASLKKQGQDDQALYDKLIAKDPKEKENIDTLLATNFFAK